LGNALRFILTGGERNDITQAQSLVEGLYAEYVIADKGYDSETFVLHLKGRDAEASSRRALTRKCSARSTRTSIRSGIYVNTT
jgi:IS5 family transposase